MNMQTKRDSFIEQLYNVGTGFIISLIYWTLVIIPQIENVEMSFMLNLSITLQFTVISVIRGFVFRRLFNYFTVRKHRLRTQLN